MAILPTFFTESIIQINDRLRIDARRSDSTPTAVASITIKPDIATAAVDVYNSGDSDLWFLDWQYDTVEADIDSTNNLIDFDEGGAELQATISAGTYTFSSLATEIKTQLDAAGSNTYTVTVDSLNRYTISSTGSVRFLVTNKVNSFLPVIGIPKDTSLKSSHVTNRVEGLPRKITVEVGDGSTTETFDGFVQVNTVEGDALYSNDGELQAIESDIMAYLPAGKSSYKYVHREAQKRIIESLDEAGWVDVFATKFDKFDIKDKSEVNAWSRYEALRLIYEDISDEVGDKWFKKAAVYESKVQRVRKRFLRIDIDQDGQVDTFEDISAVSGRLVRR